MGKKKLRKRSVSKGVHSSSTKGMLKAIRADRDPYDVAYNKIEAWSKGLNPWVTIENPTKQTNKKYIRVRANEYYGDWKRQINTASASNQGDM